MGVFGKRHGFKGAHILPPGVERHALRHTVGHKVDAVVDFLRLVFAQLIHISLHKHVDAVAAANLNIAKHAALRAVHVQIEVRLADASHLYAGNVDLFFASVVDDELLGGCAFHRHHGVEFHGVDRKGEHIVGVGGKRIVDATRKPKPHTHTYCYVEK